MCRVCNFCPSQQRAIPYQKSKNQDQYAVVMTHCYIGLIRNRGSIVFLGLTGRLFLNQRNQTNMKRAYAHPLLFFFFLIFSFSTTAQQLDHVQGEILVQFEKDVNARQWTTNHQYLKGVATQLTLKKKISEPMNIYSFTFDWVNINENELKRAIFRDKSVQNAQFNHFVQFRSTEPNDAQFNQQWQYINTGQSGGTPGADIDADLAWDVTTGGLTPEGDTIVVCVIDGGYDIDHDDLEPNIWHNYAEIPNNGVDDDNNGYVDDFGGWNTGTQSDNVTNNPWHGTSVAGIVGAKGNNGIGVAGVNWDVKLMLISGGSGVESEVLEAYSYPLTFRKKYNETNGEEGAFVVSTNASWGVDGGQPEDAPLWCAFYDTLGVHGILNAGATINGNQNVDTFGDLPTGCSSEYLVTVTNMNHDDVKVTGAGYGLTTIDLGAFGAGTWTLENGNTYDSFGGTSGATPHVAGTIALLYSAPCSNLTALAKADPAAAAAQVRDYILEGVDPNASLDGITVTGGRLNMNNSMQMLMENCGPCPAPSGLAATEVIDTLANLSWVSTGNALNDTLNWRVAGSEEWNVVADATSPYELSGLTGCTTYEFQVISNCDTVSSEYSAIFSFMTDGCCDAPEGFTISNVSDSGATATWNSVLAAESYNVQYQSPGTAGWVVVNTTETTFNFTDLAPCENYEVQIQTVCADGATEFTESLFFLTMGCGACIDMEYCAAPDLDASEEWIQTVVINTINNDSGPNDNYGDFTGAMSTEMATNNTYDVSLTPGYAGQSYSEYFTIWIDFNQDGDFEDVGESVFESYDVSDVTTGTITIPDGTPVGLTRLRVGMLYNAPGDPCSAPSGNAYGETEDYCVMIVEGTAPCMAPMNFDTVSAAENTVALQWDASTGAMNYQVRYKLVADAEWNETTLVENMLDIENLEVCSEYEAQVKTVCETGESEFSESVLFSTDCVNSTDDLSGDLEQLKVFPNPFNEQITVSFTVNEHFSEAVSVELINHLGQVITSRNLGGNIQGVQTVSFDGNGLSAGVYLVKLKSEDGKYTARKIVKMK